MKKSDMNRSALRSVSAFSASTLMVIGLTACQTGSWGTAGGSLTQTNLVPCSQSTSVFSASGAAQTFSFMGDLPLGVYVPSNFEVYIENPTVSGGQTSTSKVQTLETYSPSATTSGPVAGATLSLRCRENSGAFYPYSEALTVPVGMTHQNNGLFTMTSRTIDLSYVASANVQAATSNGGLNAADSATDLSYTLGQYWSSYTWYRRSGETYEFQGRRTDGTRMISVKASFVRRNLPTGSP